MSSHHFDAERLRHHLHDLSSNVARRLIAVLDAARDGAHEVSHEFNAVVCEITAIQRELVHELTGSQPVRAADMAAMGRMLHLHERATRLLEHLEALLAQPAFDYLAPGHPARSPQRLAVQSPALAAAPWPSAAGNGGTVPYASGFPSQSHLYSYDDPRAYVPFESLDAGAPPSRPRGVHANIVRAAANAPPRGYVPAAIWGVFALALIVALGLSATVGAHIFSDDAGKAVRLAEPAPQQRDKLMAPRMDVEVRRDSVAGGPGPTEAGEPKAPTETAAFMSVTTGALPTGPARESDTVSPGPHVSFVAVLATEDDAEGARDALARLKESYPAILGSIEAQVETVEGEGGKRWHRLTALPPVSRAEAKDLCQRLRDAGHTGCWVKPQPRTQDSAFVAVLATRNEVTAALEDFRRLKERYPSILGSVAAQVEAIQTQNGVTWHRLYTLPAISRAEAKDLCRRLRKAGYIGCWVKTQS